MKFFLTNAKRISITKIKNIDFFLDLDSTAIKFFRAGLHLPFHCTIKVLKKRTYVLCVHCAKLNSET